MLSTGEFARRTRLTVKALRVYEGTGLLRPDTVNRSNRYRRYSPSQVRTGQLIGLLRSAGLSLADVRAVLADVGVGGQVAVERLDGCSPRSTSSMPTAICSSATSKPLWEKEPI